VQIMQIENILHANLYKGGGGGGMQFHCGSYQGVDIANENRKKI
jgi:hypothetical protein